MQKKINEIALNIIELSNDKIENDLPLLSINKMSTTPINK